jgi:hypothetical protein
MANQKVTTTDSLCTVYMVCMHRCLPIPIPAHYDLPEQAYWGPGVSAHAFTGTVLHRGLRIAQEDHDLGPWLWHVPFTGLNILLPLEMMNSSRKMMFAASTVKMNGVPTGCSNTFTTPMLACSLIMPMPAYPDNDGNTVLVGMTSDDFLAGWLAVAVTVVVDLALFALEIIGLETEAEFIVDAIPDGYSPWDLLAKELGIPSSKEDFIKIAAGAACGAIKIGLTGEGTIELGVGGPAGGGGIKITKTKDGNGESSWSVDGELGGENFKRSGSTEAPRETKEEATDWSLDGSSKTSETTRRLNPDGSMTETVVEEEFDGEGRKTGGRTTTTEYENAMDRDERTPKRETTEHPLPTRPPRSGKDELL